MTLSTSTIDSVWTDVTVALLGRTDPDYSGNAVSNASFSKIFGPGTRLGWLEAPAKVRDALLSSGLCGGSGALNHTISGIMTSVMEMGLLKELLKEARPAYRVRQLDCIIVWLVG